MGAAGKIRGKRLHGGCSERKKSNYNAHPSIAEKHKQNKMKRICRNLEKASLKRFAKDSKAKVYKYKIIKVLNKEKREVYNIVRAA